MSQPQQKAVERKESPKREEANPKKEAAEAAMKAHTKRNSNAANYWMVAIFFAAMILGGGFYLYKEWRAAPNTVPAIDTEGIAAFNAKGYFFQRGPNKLFAVKIILFMFLGAFIGLG